MVLLTIFSSILLFSTSDSVHYQHIYDHPYLTKAESLLKERQFNVALFHYLSARNKFIEKGNIVGACAADIKIGAIYSFYAVFDSAALFLKEAEKLSCQYLQCNSSILADIYYRLGMMHQYDYQPDSAIFYHEKALEVRKVIYGNNATDVASSYNALADVYRYTYLNSHTAEEYYHNALQIYEESNSEKIAGTYYDLGTTARLKGDPEEALNYVNEAYRLYHQQDEKDFHHFSLCKSEIANCYYQMFDYERAIQNLREAIELILKVPSHQNHYLPNYYTNFGAIWIDTQQTDSAVYYTKKGIEVLQRAKKIDSISLANAYQQLGNAYLTLNPDSAHMYYQTGLVIIQKTYNGLHPQTASFYINLGKYSVRINNLPKAIEYYQKALEVLGYVGLDTQSFITLKFSVPEVIDAMDNLAVSKHQLFKSTYDISYLIAAYQSFKKLDQIVRQHRSTFFREKTQLRISEDIRHMYEHALSCTYDLYQLKPSEEINATLFQFMESNKAWVLLQALHQAEVYQTIGIPDSMYQKEQNLQSEITYYHAELPYYDTLKEKEQVRNIRAKIFKLEEEMQKLQQHFVTNYPNYYQGKYGTRTYSLQDLINYAHQHQTQIIEYFFGDSSIYALRIDGYAKEVSIQKFLHPENLASSIQSFLHCMSFPEDHKKDFAVYTQAASTIYNQILKPLLTGYPVQKLMIVPDGLLSFIPFEALISFTPDGENVNYASLNYLIKQYLISYSYSAQVLLSQQKKQKQHNPDQVLVFSYEEDSLKQNYSAKSQIMGTRREVENISAFYPTTHFFGKQATEHNFKKYAAQASMIHLAMHGNANPQNPYQSGILFRQDQDSIEDGFLHYHEVMNLPLRSRMAVLSACETATGHEYQGEGIYHIARSFSYAGCPTLVGALWKIDDQSTSTLMINFYQHISSGKEIDESLTLCKLAYLSKADELTAHPRYWAGLILIGDNSPIKNSKSPVNWISLGLLAGLILLAIIAFFSNF